MLIMNIVFVTLMSILMLLFSSVCDGYDNNISKYDSLSYEELFTSKKQFESRVNDGGFILKADIPTSTRINIIILRMPPNVEDDELNSFYYRCVYACEGLSEYFNDSYVVKINLGYNHGYLKATVGECKKYIKEGAKWPFKHFKNIENEKSLKKQKHN